MIPFTGAKRRSVLARLLLEPGRLVSREQLYAVAWDGEPPEAARKAVQVYVSNLRAVLADVPEAAVRGERGGYVLDVDSDLVDLHRFRRLAGSASDAPTLAAALRLWRGRALSGLGDSSLLSHQVDRLEEERLDAVERRVGYELTDSNADRAADSNADPAADPVSLLIPELLEICHQHPLRETAHGLLMRALHRAGRLGEALAVYRDLRAMLIEELGTEPSAELGALHQTLLRAGAAEPAEQAGTSSSTGAAPSVTVPAQLPAEPAAFTGREPQTERLLAALRQPSAGGVPVAVLTGYGGVGKTALGLRAAHAVRGEFPDGQLFADLRGTQPTSADPSDLLEGFLGALGVAADRVPSGLTDRASLFRSMIADRRVLIMLDDAADPAQIRPLLPGTPTSIVLVTSRSTLPGLDTTCLIELSELDPEESLTLLAAVVGPDRIGAEPDAAAAITRGCGHIPLAVRIAGGRLLTRPAWTLTAYADHLHHTSPLDELRHGDLHVRATFHLSYQHLRPEPARIFRRLALPGVAELSLHAASQILDLPPAQVEPMLAALVDLSLLTEPSPGHYRYHDLLRLFAVECAEREDGRAVHREVVFRAFGYYAGTTVAALATMMPGLSLPDPASLFPAATFPVATSPEAIAPPAPATFSDSTDAAAWMQAEHVTVTELGIRALSHESADHPTDLLGKAGTLAVLLGNYTELAGPWPGWQQLSESLLAHAERLGDRDAARRARVVLAGLAMRRADPDQVARLLEPALADASARGEQTVRGRLTAMLGVAYREAGQVDRAADRLAESLTAHREAGNVRGYAATQIHLADVDGDRGDHRAAVRRAATVLRIESGMPNRDPILRMSAYEATGDARLARGELTAAIDAYEQAYALASGHAGASTLHRIGPRLAVAYERIGRPARAAELRRSQGGEPDRTDAVGVRDTAS